MKTASGRGPLVCLLQQPLYGGPLAAAACCWWGQHADTCCVEHIFSWARRDPTHHTQQVRSNTLGPVIRRVCVLVINEGGGRETNFNAYVGLTPFSFRHRFRLGLGPF